MNYSKHIPVLLNESIEALNIIPDGVYVDCTFGRGGHSQAIYQKLSKEGKLIIFDQDKEAILCAKAMFNDQPNVFIVHSNFKNLKQKLTELKIKEVNGFLFDLGVSSPQLDDPDRGFSYHKEALLDMRMNKDDQLTASYIINNYSFKDLLYIFRNYGEIKNPIRVINSIIEKRSQTPINTTTMFVDLIKENTPIKLLYQDKHPARLYFQALRIAVNNELEILNQTFNDATSFLVKSGTLVVISFHSLEDYYVKKALHNLVKPKIPKEVPIINNTPLFSYHIHKLYPSDYEKEINYRSRSSILRAIIKNK